MKSKIAAASQDMSDKESRKRMTIDLPVSLHTKLKVVAALKNKTMAERSVNQFPSLINQQVQEALFEHLNQAEALASIALSGDFLDRERYIIHNYLGVLSDLIVRAKECSERLLNASMVKVEVS